MRRAPVLDPSPRGLSAIRVPGSQVARGERSARGDDRPIRFEHGIGLALRIRAALASPRKRGEGEPRKCGSLGRHDVSAPPTERGTMRCRKPRGGSCNATHTEILATPRADRQDPRTALVAVGLLRKSWVSSLGHEGVRHPVSYPQEGHRPQSFAHPLATEYRNQSISTYPRSARSL